MLFRFKIFDSPLCSYCKRKKKLCSTYLIPAYKTSYYEVHSENTSLNLQISLIPFHRVP